MKAIAYIRVSTERQANEGVSLAAQEDRIRAWCRANDVELVNIFVDAGLSGGRADNRPELQKALTAVCKLKAVLVVYSLSRLARSTRDSIVIADRLHSSGADLASLTEKIDTTSASGRLFFRLMAALAEFERDLISERTSSSMQHKRSQGERVGKVPFGFLLAADGTSLTPCPNEQRTLGLITELRERGQSLRKIAAELTARGIPTKEGKGPWTHSTLARIVSRPAV